MVRSAQRIAGVTLIGLTVLLTASVAVESNGRPPVKTPLYLNGKLSIKGTNITNSSGNPIQLRGMSTHGINWYGEFYRKYPHCFDTLATVFGADMVRLSMYIHEYDDVSSSGVGSGEVSGYLADATPLDSFTQTKIYKDTNYYRTLYDTLIDKAKSVGIYAIVDWHMLQYGDPNYYDINDKKSTIPASKAFFDYISKKHGKDGHVIYEICNEPNNDEGTGSWKNIYKYANQIIPTIRANDPDGIIIIGTPDFAARPDQVVIKDLTNSHNVIFTSHIYMDRTQDDMDNTQAAIDAGIPVIVTEWGCQTFTGDGANDKAEGQKWVDFWKKNNISWAIWNYSPDALSGAVWSTAVKKTGEFTTANLKQSGTYAKTWLNVPVDNFKSTVPVVAPAVSTVALGVTAVDNPVTGVVSIRFNCVAGEQSLVKIINLKGETVFEKAISGGELLWNGMTTAGRPVAPGLLVVSVQGASGGVVTQQFLRIGR